MTPDCVPQLLVVMIADNLEVGISKSLLDSSSLDSLNRAFIFSTGIFI